jgi:intracellular multiplication protein IcmJ
MFLDLSLSVKRSVFRRDDFSSDAADKDFLSKRPLVLERDDHTCRFCGFKAYKFQEVHHLDDNHSNNDESNLVTACVLCHSACHIGFSGIQKRGVLIHIDPSIPFSQGSLNQLTRALWVGEMSSDDDVRVNSSVMLSKLFKLSVSARRKFGTSELNMLSDFMLNLDDKDYCRRKEALSGLFFLPLKDAFSKHLSYWASENFKSLDSSDWECVAKDKLKRWCCNDTGKMTDFDLLQYLNKQ